MSTVRDPATYIPFNKPFFRDGCVVKRNNRTLVEGVDFYFGHTYVLGTLRHAKLAYGSIWVFNKADLAGLNVTAEQLPHGSATTEQIEAEEALNKNTIPPYRCWDDVILDVYYPPINIEFDEDNWHGELELMLSIDKLNKALIEADPTEDDLYQIAKLWFDTVERVFANSPIHQHLLNTDNPHREEYNWVDALVKDGKAANAAKIYNRTLEVLTTYVNDRSAKQSDLTNKVVKVGRKYLQDTLRFKNGVGYISKNGAQLSINNKHLSVSTKDNIELKGGGKSLHFKSGNNTLSLHPDERRMRFNNIELLTEDTIGPYIPTTGTVGNSFKFESWANLKITGEGTQAKPAVFEWVLPDEGEPTLHRVVKTQGQSVEHAAHISLLDKYNTDYGKFLVIGVASINGRPIVEDTVLDKSWVNLGRVDNIADKDLPISAPQEMELQKYADKDHRHGLFEFGIATATETNVGTVVFSTYKADEAYNVFPEEGEEPENPIANQHHLVDVVKRIEDAEALESNFLPNDAIQLIRYGNTGNGKIDFTLTGSVLTIPRKVPYYVNKYFEANPQSFDLAVLLPNEGTRLYFYVTVEPESGTVTYSTTTQEIAESELTTYIGYAVKVGNVYKAIIRSRTRLGNFVELAEHVNNPTIHGGVDFNKESLGLGVVENMPPSFNLTKPTFKEVFNTWRRFSHGKYSELTPDHHAGVGDAQPANVQVLNRWEFDEATDRLVMPSNCGSFVGFVSPNKYGSYIFDTVFSSTDVDDDQIGVLLGFYLDEDGVEHTLGMSIRNDGGFKRFGTVTPTAGAIIINQNQGNTPGRAPFTVGGTWEAAKQATLGWNQLGEIRVRVERRGDRFVIDVTEFTRWGSLDKFHETLVFDLSTGFFQSVTYTTDSYNVTRTATVALPSYASGFRGGSHFGYVSISQAMSTYRNLVRPDEDSRNFYATLPTLLDEVSYFAKQRFLIEKTPLVRNGQNHLITHPNGVGLQKYNRLDYVPWSRYTYETMEKLTGYTYNDRLGVLSLDPNAFLPVDTINDTVAESADVDRMGYDPFNI